MKTTSCAPEFEALSFILKALDLLQKDEIPTLSPSSKNTDLGLKEYFEPIKDHLVSLF